MELLDDVGADVRWRTQAPRSPGVLESADPRAPAEAAECNSTGPGGCQPLVGRTGHLRARDGARRGQNPECAGDGRTCYLAAIRRGIMQVGSEGGPLVARSTTRRKSGAYQHSEGAVLRPEAGTQAQFKKKKPPKTVEHGFGSEGRSARRVEEVQARTKTQRGRGYVRSKQRVADHGEVFTPPWMVDAMLDLVKAESERIDARILEPACGSGNFLIPVLRRKLNTVQARYDSSDFERRHQALLALMSIYGIELLADNVAECRENLLEVFVEYLQVGSADEWYPAAANVLRVNIVHGDALSMITQGEERQAITFPEWAYLGKGMYRRRDFRFDTLTQMSSFGGEDTLFADLGKHEIFTPTRDYGSLSIRDIAVEGASR
jgi:hypothetical protein